MTDVDARSVPWPDKLCQIGQIGLGQIGQSCGQSGAARLEYPIERNRAIEPIGQSRADWEILCDLGRRLSERLGLGLDGEFSYGHSSELFDEMARLTPMLAGISYERLDNEGGIQWPCPAVSRP